MAVDHESLKRALMSVKDKARGWKRDKMQERIAPKPPELEAEGAAPPLEMGEEAAPEALLGEVGADPMAEAPLAEAPMEPDADAAAKLEMIRKLIGSV